VKGSAVGGGRAEHPAGVVVAATLEIKEVHFTEMSPRKIDI